jgi:hypothetical protein
MHHYIKVWLQTEAEPLSFPVAEAAWGRFKRSFAAKREGFFIFAAQDGRTVALNLKYARLAQLWLETDGKKEPACAEGHEVMLLYAHSDAVTFEARDSLEWAGIFSSIRAAKGGEVLSFTDSNGRLVMFSTDELMLLAAPTVFVEEGYKQIYFRERGTLPPS